MSFACPHFDIDRDYCLALDADCVPGRPGCVLRSRSVFFVPAEDRVKEAEVAKADDVAQGTTRAKRGGSRKERR